MHTFCGFNLLRKNYISHKNFTGILFSCQDIKKKKISIVSMPLGQEISALSNTVLIAMLIISNIKKMCSLNADSVLIELEQIWTKTYLKREKYCHLILYFNDQVV